MKRVQLVKALRKKGWYPCHGKDRGPHQSFCHEATSLTIEVPRHKEINERLAQKILNEADKSAK